MDQVSWTKSENRNDFESFFDFSPWNDHSRSFKPESFVLNAIRRSLLAEQVKLRLTKTSRGKKGLVLKLVLKLALNPPSPSSAP